MNMLTPVAIRIGGLAWLPRFLKQITAIDRLIQRLTRGRWSLLGMAGLPSMLLTVAGRKSGIVRSTPVLCVPHRSGYLVAGSNFGAATPPVWVLNVQAAEVVTVIVDGVQHDAVPREVTGAEREAAWARMIRVWPNYAKYAGRTDRVIPVFMLEPVGRDRSRPPPPGRAAARSASLPRSWHRSGRRCVH